MLVSGWQIQVTHTHANVCTRNSGIHGELCDVGAHMRLLCKVSHLIPDASGHTFCIKLAPPCAVQGYRANQLKGWIMVWHSRDVDLWQIRRCWIMQEANHQRTHINPCTHPYTCVNLAEGPPCTLRRKASIWNFKGQFTSHGQTPADTNKRGLNMFRGVKTNWKQTGVTCLSTNMFVGVCVRGVNWL